MPEFPVLADCIITTAVSILGVYCITMSIVLACEYYNTIKNKTIYDTICVCFLVFILAFIGSSIILLVIDKTVSGFKFF